jgi:hypothetical protein
LRARKATMKAMAAISSAKKSNGASSMLPL